MYFVAALLVVLAGLFYAAGHHEIGSLGVEMCRYGSTFCDSPIYVLAGAARAGHARPLAVDDASGKAAAA